MIQPLEPGPSFRPYKPPSATVMPHPAQNGSTERLKSSANNDDTLDIMPSRAGRKLCVRHKQMANQNVNQKLQRSLDNLPTSERSDVTHLWSTFSNAPHAKRKLILEGILTMCCFSQLSHISDSLNLLIRIDPFSLLPREVNLRILGYLDAISLGRAAQVSKKWKALADDDLLWRRMCGQHIDRKCEKCGWGLPLLERRRLKGELNRGSPAVAVGVGRHGEGGDHGHVHEGEAVAMREEILAVRKAAELDGLPTSTKGTGKDQGGMTVCDTPTPHLLGGGSAKRDRSSELPQAVKRIKIQHASDSESEGSLPEDQAVSGKGKGKAMKLDGQGAEANGDDGGSLSRQVRMTRPWKSVYCERLVVERNWRKGRCKMSTFKGHEDGVMCLQYHTSLASPPHPVLITGSYDKTVRVWNLDTGECLRVLRGHTRAVRALQFDQRLLFTGAMDGTVRIWNWRQGECLRVLEGHSDGVVSLAYNGYLLASGSADSTINIWNFKTGNKFTLRGHDEWVNNVVLWDGKTNPGDLDPTQMPSFASLSAKRSASPVRASTPSVTTPGGTSAPLGIFPTLPPGPTTPGTTYMPRKQSAPSIEPGTMLFSAADDATIKLWDLATRECIRTFNGHKAQVQSLKVIMLDMTEKEMAMRKRLRSASPPGSALYDSTSPSTAYQSQVPSSGWQSASQAALAPNGSVAAEGRFVDVPDGFDPHGHRRKGRYDSIEPKVFVHNNEEGSDQVEPASGMSGAAKGGQEEEEEDGKGKRPVLVTGSLDGTIKIWDVETGQEENTLFGHIEGVWGVEIDALRIASASHDRTVKVWDRNSGQCVQTIAGHRGAVTSLQLSDDMIVSGSDDGDVMVWSFAPGASGSELGGKSGSSLKAPVTDGAVSQK